MSNQPPPKPPGDSDPPPTAQDDDSLAEGDAMFDALFGGEGGGDYL